MTHQALIDNAVPPVAAARDAGTPVVFVQHCEAVAGSPFKEGTVHSPLHEALRPGADLARSLRAA